MAKTGKGNRQCGYCKKTGHNMRTCTLRKEATPEGTAVMAVSIPQETPRGAPMPVESGVSMPASFEEQRIQSHFHGQTLSVAAREYQNGSSTVAIRHTPEASSPKELLLDLTGAAQLHQMLTQLLQRHVAAQSAKPKPLARANGVAYTPPPPQAEIQPS